MKEQRRKISDDFKRRVVLEVLSGKLCKEEARRVFDIRGNSSIKIWIERFGSEFGWIDNPGLGLPNMKRQELALTPEQLVDKIKELEKTLELERHRTGLYKKLIEVAERDLNIDITKKRGAKQSENTKRK